MFSMKNVGMSCQHHTILALLSLLLLPRTTRVPLAVDAICSIVALQAQICDCW